MKAKKSNRIRFEQSHCNTDLNDQSVLFVKVSVSPEEYEEDTYVEVPLSHSILIVLGGSNVKFFENGPRPLFSTKEEKKNWSKKGFSADVFYIAKEGMLKVEWGTPTRTKFRDEASGHVVNFGANGEFNLMISNPIQFYKTTAITSSEFNTEAFKKMFRKIVASLFVEIFLKVFNEKHLTYDQCDAHKREIGEEIGAILSEKLTKENGVKVNNFIFDIFWVPEDEAAIEAAAADRVKQSKLKEYLAEVERLDDKEWEREKYLRQLELQDKTAYYEVLKVIGSNNKSSDAKKVALECPNCHRQLKPQDKFCPQCGHRVSKDPIICPDCKTQNDSSALFCAHCGKSLTAK